MYLALLFVCCNSSEVNNSNLTKEPSICSFSSHAKKKQKKILSKKKEVIIKNSNHYKKKIIPEIIIQNELDYSKSFIDNLKKIENKKFKLIDNLIIINETDSVFFPDIPKVRKKIFLEGIKNDIIIHLTIRRLNYTTIDYSLSIFKEGKKKFIDNGKANISTSFFLSDESDESEKTGINYFVTEFSNIKENDCNTYIRLGYEQETGDYLLGKLIKNCIDDLEDISLDNFTTLIEYTD